MVAGSAPRPWLRTACTCGGTASRRSLCCSLRAVSPGLPLADPIVGLMITVAILALLRTAVRDVFRRLLDGVDPRLVETAERTLAARPGVRSVRSVRMRWIGHRLHADAELDVDPALNLTEAHHIAHEAEHDLTHAVPRLTTALIHAYPAHDGVAHDKPVRN